MPAVSVLTAVYNGARYLDETIESVRAQTLVDWEFVIVDDGSEDETPRLLEQWVKREPRILVFRQANAGLTRALNRGLELATGAYVARIDVGDVARSDRFAKQKAFLDQRADHVAVGSHLLWITPEGWPVGTHLCSLTHDAIDQAHLAGLPGQVPHAGMMARRAALLDLGSYCDDFVVAQDYDLLLRLGEVGRLANVDEVLTKCRLDPEGVSSRRREDQIRWAREAVTRARSRRGLPALDALAALWTAKTHTDLLDKWVRQAIVSGYYSTGRRYGWRLLRAQPQWAAARLFLRAAYEEVREAVLGPRRIRADGVRW
jgi:glycosyltransferase involved in cell wall biosynthesis